MMDENCLFIFLQCKPLYPPIRFFHKGCGTISRFKEVQLSWEPPDGCCRGNPQRGPPVPQTSAPYHQGAGLQRELQSSHRQILRSTGCHGRGWRGHGDMWVILCFIFTWCLMKLSSVRILIGLIPPQPRCHIDQQLGVLSVNLCRPVTHVACLKCEITHWWLQWHCIMGY